MSEPLKTLLTQHFGYSQFRGAQQEVLEALYGGENVLLVMPTGMGKSLCYQLPHFFLEGLVLVISPLIALMKDQVDAAKKLGIKAEFINSSLKPQQRLDRYEKLKKGQIEMLFVTPERFKKEEFRQALRANKVALLAVDEAHCISQWGHDFRPDYSRLAEFQAFLGHPLTLALTATATPEVQEDILNQLGGPERFQTYTSGVERENLNLRVHDVYGEANKLQRMYWRLVHNSGSAIVYFSLIQNLKKASYDLEKLGVSHWVYHGLLEDRFRKKSQEQFLNSPQGVMLATPAFGLGINKPDIRLVIHNELPSSIEAYYQEVGRAGRDGESSLCELLWDSDDISIQMDFIKWSNPDPSFIRRLYHLIRRNEDRLLVEGLDYLRAELNFYNRRDFRLETALNLLERWGSIERRGSNKITALEEPDQDYLNEKLYQSKLNRQNEKLLQLVQWANGEDCRKKVIYQYFGHKVQEDYQCGNCDRCRPQEELSLE